MYSGAAASLASLLMSGCFVASERGPSVSHYFGYVRVMRAPADHGNPEAAPARVTALSALGAWVESGRNAGVGVGWRDTRQVVLTPECRIVFVVKSKAQLRSAVALVNGLEKGKELCVESLPSP